MKKMEHSAVGPTEEAIQMVLFNDCLMYVGWGGTGGGG